MTIETLAASLLGRLDLQSRLRSITIDSVAAQFANLKQLPNEDAAVTDWTHLLECASVLAQSKQSDCEDSALRIAQHTLTKGPDGQYRDAACVILDLLTNKAAIRLAEKRQLILPEFAERLPLSLRTGILRREAENLVLVGSGRELILNRFQIQAWNAAKTNQTVSVTAPTSTGKSFLLYQHVMEHVRTSPNALVIYIVPTRALIQQVENDLRHLLALEAPESPVNVSSLPLATSIKPLTANVMVLTQERLHILMIGVPAPTYPSMMIVDEAHKVADGARGVLLNSVIDSIAIQNPDMKLLFASPMVSNPEILLRGRDKSDTHKSISSSHVTVNQNLIWVSQVPYHPTKWNVEACIANAMVPLGEIELPFRPTPQSKRLTFVASVLADPQGGNLIYADGAADAEKAAHQIWDLRDPSLVVDGEVKSLIDLIKTYVHPQYSLANTLARGVAFHYGNMPLLIRTEIERLFKKGNIKFLVCTSTLIEGVNLPCKSIFVRGPRKGRGHPMNEADFWNLAGRAGRLGQEFQGNIICIDPCRKDVWPVPPPVRRTTYAIKPAADTIFEDLAGFLDFIRNQAPSDVSMAHPEFNQLVTYLLSQYNSITGLSDAPACAPLSANSRMQLESVIKAAQASLTIPLALINRNPGISPFGMQRLLHSFRQHKGNLEQLVPTVPESDDAVQVFADIFERINASVAPVFAPSSRAFALSILIVDWMRGHSLARLIASRLRYMKRKNRKHELPNVIRAVMDDVEQVARFSAPRYLSCYVDVLRLHLQECERRDLSENIPDVTLWLEFGASQRTQLSMMGLGLSRTTAIALSEFIVDDSLSEDAVLEKLRSLDIASLNLPAAVVREINQLLPPKPQAVTDDASQ